MQTKRVYDLSPNNQAMDVRRILIADSGKQFDVSFVPAIVNRKYYKRWNTLQATIIGEMQSFFDIQNKVRAGIILTQEDNTKVKEFNALAEEAAEAGLDLLIYVLRANGYEEVTEDEIFMNFSEAGISKAIQFVMGLADEEAEENKKKVTSKRKA